MLHHFEHQPVSVCRSAFVFKCLYLSAFKYESVYLNPNPGYVKWCGISGQGSIKTAFSLPPPLSFLEISPKAMLVDNNVSICVYACKYVSVYQLEGELIRAHTLFEQGPSFPKWKLNIEALTCLYHQYSKWLLLYLVHIQQFFKVCFCSLNTCRHLLNTIYLSLTHDKWKSTCSLMLFSHTNWIQHQHDQNQGIF